MTPSDDITARFHKGSETSRLANLKTAPRKETDRMSIMEYARTVAGLTVKDVRRVLGLEHQTASARLTDLKAAGLLIETKERREGCKVLKIPPGQPTLWNNLI